MNLRALNYSELHFSIQFNKVLFCAGSALSKNIMALKGADFGHKHCLFVMHN